MENPRGVQAFRGCGNLAGVDCLLRDGALAVVVGLFGGGIDAVTIVHVVYCLASFDEVDETE